MISKQLLGLLLLFVVCLNATQSQSEQMIEKGKELFNRLDKSSQLGHEIYQTIELQIMNSENEEGDGVEESDIQKVIRMLYEVRLSVQDQNDNLVEEKEKREGNCLSQLQEIRDSIQDYNDRIKEQKSFLPSRKTDFDAIQEQITAKADEVEFYNRELDQITQLNGERVLIFQSKRDEHRRLISALEEAKRIISQLSSQQSLLQTNPVFVQIKSHHETQFSALKETQNKKLFSVLMEMSKDITSQDEVESILEIIDQLIAAQEQIKYSEEKSEQSRQERFEADSLRYQANIQQAQADSLDLQADMSTTKTRLKELERGIEDNRSSLDLKKIQLVDQETQCADSVKELTSRAANLSNILEILDQVIFLMENSSISHAKMMFNQIKF